MVLRNSGKKEARDIEICHGFPVKDYDIYPSKEVRFKDYDKKDENLIMMIDNLVPGEMVTISHIQPRPYTIQFLYSYIKSKEGLAKQILVAYQQIFSKKIIFILRVVIIWGVFCFLYVLYKLIF